MLPWYDIWSMFKKSLQNFASSRKETRSIFLGVPLRQKCAISSVQQRLSIYSWNPGLRRGKEDASERQIEGRWHVITLQEASEYVDHDILTYWFLLHQYGRQIHPPS